MPKHSRDSAAPGLFGFKARQQLHKSLCACWRNTEAEQKDQQDGIFFDRNRLIGHWLLDVVGARKLVSRVGKTQIAPGAALPQ